MAGRAMMGITPTPAAKIQPPRPAPGVLLRSRLLDALYEHAECRLQFVLAPAGFGKTTLLTDFVHGAPFPSAWATLDAGDRDPVTFVETVHAALRRIVPSLGERTLAALHGPADAAERMPAIARILAQEVEEAIDELTVLVLDDYHEADESAAVTAFMDELLRRLPDTLRILIAGRTIPGITISRLIVERQVFGLGEADLRFTSAELMALLRRSGQEVAPGDVAALAERAEGWIAGFLLSVPQLWTGLVNGLIAGRGEGALYDYLAAEAFDRQPEHIQRFLLETSAPETADLDVVAALLGPGSWSSLLDEIERAGLFITRLRSGRDAFRYHQLFRRFLQARLRETDPEAYRRGHGRTAGFLAERGQWQLAIAHYQEAGDQTRAIALLDRVAPELERSGRRRSLAEAVAAVGIDALRERPGLLLAGARAALHLGEAARAEPLIDAVAQIAVGHGDRGLEAWALCCRGHLRRLQGRTSEAEAALHQAIALAPEDGELAATARRHLGKCLGVRGDFAGAAEALRGALAYFDQTGAAYDAAQSEFGLGVALAKSGQLPEAIGRYQSALARWRSLGDPAMEAELLNCLGCAHMYQGDHERARIELQEALTRAEQAEAPSTQALTLHSLSDVLLAIGDVAGARMALQRGLQLAQDVGDLWAVTQIYDALALVAAFEGDVVRAEERAHHAIALAQRQESAYLEAMCRMTLAAIQSRRGRAEAVKTATEAVTRLASLGADRELTRAHLWLAQAHRRVNNEAGVREHLAKSLALADELGLDGIFDLHARWDPALFVDAPACYADAARLQAVLDRASIARPAVRPPVRSLPGYAVRAFGPGVVTTTDDQVVAWPWDKAREMFFFLVHQGPRRRDQIVAALWPDTPPAQAKPALHTAVYRLRRATCPELIVLSDGVYRVNDELIDSYDVRQFERLARDASSLSGTAAITALRQAVELYRGPFLEEIEGEWCAGERDYLERRYLATLEQLLTALAAAGSPHESITIAERLLMLDPSREDVHAHIVRAYLRLGDRAAARRHLDHCVSVLHDELGVEPGPDLQSLLRRTDA
jgi:LuxR family transcriptional regulator, maltose regulon positive regulatory protein